ncbi:MAG: hypothetical protein KIS66_07240 [Fimbriimonadaceae bacterium]|nr:hypothetical protein [Fimbriimonadaceae bacterium]
MISRRVLIAVAIGMVLVLVNRAVTNLSFVPLIFTGVFLYALFELARPLVAEAFRSCDPYDLKELRRIQERKEYEDLELVSPDDADTVVCPNCFESYPARLKVCPRCGAG